MLALLAALVLSQPSMEPASVEGPLYAHTGHVFKSAFEFAPSDGFKMGPACLGTTPSGTRGEVLTFTRGSVGTCLKSNTLTGINNGELVKLSSGQAAVMPGGNGAPPVGLLVEESRANSTLQSEDLANAAWLQNADSAPRNTTVTADTTTAPDGTLTADRLDLIATTGVQFSSRAQTAACAPSTTGVYSGFVRGIAGVSDTGTVDLCLNGGCVQCPFVSSSWTRCVTPATATTASPQVAIGNLTVNTSVSRPAQSVAVWGQDCEAGAFATSYIPTTTASVSRSAVVADVAITVTTPATISFAATIAPPSAFSSAVAFTGVPGDGTPGTDTGSVSYMYIFGSGGSNIVMSPDFDGRTVPNSWATTLSAVAGATGRYAASFDGTNANAWFNGTQGAAQAATWTAPTWTRYRLNGFTSGNGSADGVMKLICLDTNSSRCR